MHALAEKHKNSFFLRPTMNLLPVQDVQSHFIHFTMFTYIN